MIDNKQENLLKFWFICKNCDYKSFMPKVNELKKNNYFKMQILFL